MKIDVQDLDADFLVFSGHKMLAPLGIGVLYGKKELLNNIRPIIFGGGMNSSYNSDMSRIYNLVPTLLEAGTPNIAGVIGFGAVIDYLNKIDFNEATKYELDLRKYALAKLKENKNIIIYNEKSEGSIIAINYEGIFAQDLAIYLNKYNICVRAGNHCSKILKDEINIKNTVRISLSFYNTKEEVDKLIEVLNNPNIKNEII
jgi:cysteine desulfurase/selenocysteine lyase